MFGVVGNRGTRFDFRLSERKQIHGKTAYNDLMSDSFDSVREALDALKNGDISPGKVREKFGHVDGIERSISVATAKRNQDMAQEEFEESFDAEFEMDEEWPTLTEARETNWPPDWDASARVKSVVYGLRQPRETEWVAERADVDVGRAEEVLEGFDWVSSLDGDGERWYPCSIEERDEYRDERWSER